MEEVEVSVVEIDGKKYILADSINDNKNVYHYFSNIENQTDVYVFKDGKDEEVDSYVSLDTEYEFKFNIYTYITALAFLNNIGINIDNIIEIRRDIHQYPEIGMEEVRTSALVKAELEKLGMEVQDKIGKMGGVCPDEDFCFISPECSAPYPRFQHAPRKPPGYPLRCA